MARKSPAKNNSPRTLAADRRARPTDPTVKQQQQDLKDEGKCGARTKAQDLCRKGAGWGTDHPGFGACKLHGGNMPNHIRAAQLHEAAEAVQYYGLPRDVDPFDALLEELARTAGHVDWLRMQVGTLTDSDLINPVGTAGPTESGAIQTPRYEPHAFVRLYQEERDHLTKVAATCIKVGIDERKIEIAERQGALIAVVLNGVLKELGIDPESAQEILRKHLAMAAELSEGDTMPGSAREITQAVSGN